MNIVFDVAEKTHKIDRRMKLFFQDYYFDGIYNKYGAQIYHLVVDNKVVGVVHLDMRKGYSRHVNPQTGIFLTGTCWVYCLEILRPFRGLGYGKILLQEIEKVCIDNNQYQILLEVDDPVAFELYKNFGFEITKSYFNANGEKEHSMVKLLNNKDTIINHFQNDEVICV
jgi:ribosomal protein S18 acetylase RimI-like enzyme